MRIRRPGDISSTLREVTLKTHFLSGTAFKRCNLITFVQLFCYVFNKNRLFFCTLNSRASKHYYNTHEVTWHFRILYIHHLISIISSFSLSFFSVVWSLLLLLFQPKSINTAKKKISLTVWSNRYFHYWSTESIKCQKERDEKDFFFLSIDELADNFSSNLIFLVKSEYFTSVRAGVCVFEPEIQSLCSSYVHRIGNRRHETLFQLESLL